MQATFIGVLENEDGSNTVSLYRLPSDEYRIWIKMGVGLIEIKEDQMDELIHYLQEIKEIIKSEVENAGQ